MISAKGRDNYSLKSFKNTEVVLNQNKNTLIFLLRYGVHFLAMELWKITENVSIIFKYLWRFKTFYPSIVSFCSECFLEKYSFILCMKKFEMNPWNEWIPWNECYFISIDCWHLINKFLIITTSIYIGIDNESLLKVCR